MKIINWLKTNCPALSNTAIKARDIKANTIKIGIAESALFYTFCLFIGDAIVRDYRVNHQYDNNYEYLEIFILFLFVPFLNLIFRNYRAILGNIIGIPVAGFALMFIAALFFGYRG